MVKKRGPWLIFASFPVCFNLETVPFKLRVHLTVSFENPLPRAVASWWPPSRPAEYTWFIPSPWGKIQENDWEREENRGNWPKRGKRRKWWNWDVMGIGFLFSFSHSLSLPALSSQYNTKITFHDGSRDTKLPPVLWLAWSVKQESPCYIWGQWVIGNRLPQCGQYERETGDERETPGAGAERRREKGSKYYDFFHCMMG